MNTTQNKLYVDLTTTDWPLPSEAAIAKADGYVLASADLPAGLDTNGKDILVDDGLPHGSIEQDMAELDHTRICGLGLAKTARLRDEFPARVWIPRVAVTRLETAYHFPTTHYSEGFRTFQPVFAAQSPYQVCDGDTPIISWLKRAAELGFDNVWLHACQAETAQKGLDLDLREVAVKNWSGNLWLSGGAQTIMHLKYLVKQGGVAALVVPAKLACALGCDKILDALQMNLNGVERKAEVVGQVKTPPSNDLPEAG